MPKRVALVAIALLSAASRAGAGEEEAALRYRATIRRTGHGVPHITASDLGGLGFGEGYAFAQDHPCSLADQVVRARGERARYFGRGEKDEHLNNDIAARALRVVERGREDLARAPAEVREWFTGYAAGYNQYLKETGAEGLPGFCRGQPWVQPIGPEDLFAHFRTIVLTTRQMANEIAAARPPSGAATSRGPGPEALGELDAGGSNGWAIGSERSESGRGMLLANPHYPWVGSSRFWEKHLTIPGRLDVYGAGLLGTPGVAIGFNRQLAWTHTVSAGRRFTAYRLSLVPGEPTKYLYDGRPREMSTRQVGVDVRQADGSLTRVERTVYFSHHGPVVSLRGLEWTEAAATAVRDANEDNEEWVATWLAMGRARSLDELKQALGRHAGIPFVNTIAASADGRAYYADTAAAPNLSRQAIAAWLRRVASDPDTRSAEERRIILLDGSDSRFEWVDEPGQRDPGVAPFAKVPQIERRDYVFNANDSYWVPHAQARLTGFSPAHGREGRALSLRTRMNALLLADRGPGGPAGKDGRFSLDELAAAALSNRSYAAELVLPELRERCAFAGPVTVDGEALELGPACRAIGSYDGRLDLESRGAVLFRELVTQYDLSDLRQAGPLFSGGFDTADPIGTPRGLAPAASADPVLTRLARAARTLERAGIRLDAALGDLQHAERGGRRIPVHGGIGEWEGVTNLVEYSPNTSTLEPDPEVGAPVKGSRFLRRGGYPVNRGTSFIMVVELAKRGPRAKALLTYGETGDPASPLFFDQTELFSAKRWRPILFSEEEVRSDPGLRTTTVSGPRPKAR